MPCRSCQWILALTVFAAALVDNRPAVAEVDATAAAAQIVEQTNAFRNEQGLESLQTDKTLEQTAQDFADFMARTMKYGHTADGRQPAERAAAHGYDYCLVLENIAYQFSSTGYETGELADEFVTGWKNSPGHRKNMLDPDVTETGVAVSQSEDGYWYAVQLFGRPRTASISFQVANRSGGMIRYRLGDQTFQLGSRFTRTHQICRPSELALLPPATPPAEDAADPSDEPEVNPIATVTPDNFDVFTIVTGDDDSPSIREENKPDAFEQDTQ